MADVHCLVFFLLSFSGVDDRLIGLFSALKKITVSSRVRHAPEEGKFTVLFNSGFQMGSDIIRSPWGISQQVDTAFFTKQAAHGRPHLHQGYGGHTLSLSTIVGTRIWHE